MEAVLHESTNALNNASDKSENPRDNKFVEINCENGANNYQNGYATFAKFQPKHNVDIQFENVTFTAVEGNIFTKRSKFKIQDR